MFKRARSSAVVALLVLVAGLAIAACGSSSSQSASASSAGASSSSGSGSTTSSGTSTTGARGGFAAITASQRSCLKSKGVTLPTGGGFRRGTGTFTRPSGATPPGGGSGTGAPGGAPGGGGLFGGGGTGRPGSANASKFASAFKACGVSFGGGFRGGFAGAGAGAGRGGAGQVSKTAITAFVACVKRNGYDLTGVNTSGKGSVLPASLRTNKKFLAAAKSCTSLLRSTGGAGGTSTTAGG